MEVLLYVYLTTGLTLYLGKDHKHVQYLITQRGILDITDFAIHKLRVQLPFQ